jgi:hypothetical protein
MKDNQQQPTEQGEKRFDSNALLYAFVQGAKWWEHQRTGFTMWQSDQELAWKTAECRLAAGVLVKQVI